MGDCAIGKTRFETTPLALEAAFDGGRITSDGELIWLAETKWGTVARPPGLRRNRRSRPR